MTYNPQEIEKKWQNYWEENKIFRVENDFSKPKYYSLDMFPFPSGEGLHVGHPKGYVANDIIARYKNAKGFNVLHPMGWDAFGLPAENFAIKTGTHPRVKTNENIKNYRRQLKSIGFSYDWDREINTTDPEYYKWTQWIFLKMFEHGLAYEQDLPINYCPSCKTGLANEEVLNDFTCERCGEKVEKKKIRQWVLAITKYADRLLEGVDKLDWAEGIKEMQRNWIGKSEGCEFEMKKAQKNNEVCISENRVGLNCPAKTSLLEGIIYQKVVKVKKKNHFLNKIEGIIKNQDKEIIFNSENILKHFKSKQLKEFHYRRNLLGIIFYYLDNIDFNEENIGYILYKRNIIKIVLGKQNNGKYYIKTFFLDDKKTKQYQELLEKEPSIRVYTTRIDTVFGMTYAVVAPDHKDVEKFITEEQKEACEKYIKQASQKSDQDRTADDKEKTGVFTGSYVINPFNGKEVPLWIADYVLGNYGTGAVMAVSAHDTRDFEFARKYDLPIVQSIAKSFEYKGKDAPKKGVETLYRKTIDIILENENGEICLQIEKHSNGEHIHLIGGGIDEGDSELETVSKELIEETGYTDFEIIGPVNLSYAKSLGFRANKNKNQECIGRVFHVKLKSDKQQKSEIDDGKHSIKWVKKEEVGKLINWEGHIDFWNHFYKGELPFTEYGILVNSGEFDGLDSKTAQEKLIEYAEKKGFGKKKINYKLRDWLFSRQRYWGEPIPLIHLEIEQVKKLPHISEEEFSELQGKIENYLNKKMRSATPKMEGVGPLANTATFSYINNIIQNVGNVKQKLHNVNFKDFLKEKNINGINYIFNGRYLLEHFKNKTRREIALRKKLLKTIYENFEKVSFLGDYGIIKINNKILLIVLEKIGNKKYNILTYYNLTYLNKFLNKAYILKRAPKEGENVTGAICPSSGMVRELIIGGKVFSKIYDGIYGKIVCDYRLPLELPEVKDFAPAGDGQSPLAKVDNFVNVKLAENLTGKRETNTMPQWGGSCWYYLRYMDPHNDKALVDPEIEKYWGQVDSYIGGAEHAVLHLLYARFWHKFLYDIGVVSYDEPFYKLRSPGLITAFSFQNEKGKLIANDLVEEKDGKYFNKENGEELKQVIAKMSKSLKNVENPDKIIEEYGADSLRLYEMYMADFKDAAPWDTKNMIGVRRFLEKVERLYKIPHPNPLLKEEREQNENPKIAKDDKETMKLLNKTIKKVEEDIENYKFNTAIASLMILVNNGLPKDEKLQKEFKVKLVIILSPFAPHLAEELWDRIRKENHELYDYSMQYSATTGDSIFDAIWPEYDRNLVVDDTIKIAVQVLGKVRGTIEISKDEDKESVLEKAKNEEGVKKWIEGKNIVKEIYVPGKIVNLVVK